MQGERKRGLAPGSGDRRVLRSGLRVYFFLHTGVLLLFGEGDRGGEAEDPERVDGVR